MMSTKGIFKSSQSLASGSLARTCLSFYKRTLTTIAAPPITPKKTVVDLQKMKNAGEKITMVTAYTHPSAVHVDSAGIDMILVGDSVAMVELGFNTTLPVTLDQMLYHCKAVARGASRALLVGDMPFGTYEVSEQVAYDNAIRFLKEGSMDAVKLEGGLIRAKTVNTLVRGGVAVMGHIGLTPQAYSVIGGFRSQGRSTAAALALLDDARALQDAGCFSVVIECVPPEVGLAISQELEIPTIGIGAGTHTDGQVLVYHDLLGMMEHEHYKQVSPKFCKRFAELGPVIHGALTSYRDEVRTGAFPGTGYAPYKMPAADLEAFNEALAQRRSQSPSPLGSHTQAKGKGEDKHKDGGHGHGQKKELPAEQEKLY